MSTPASARLMLGPRKTAERRTPGPLASRHRHELPGRDRNVRFSMASERQPFDRRRASVLAVALALGLDACAYDDDPGSLRQGASKRPSLSASSSGGTLPAPTASAPPRAASATPSSTPTPERPRPLPATLSIPSLRLKGLVVVPYTGSPDDGPGTRIQNRGVAASPFGNSGGVGPGQV